MPSLWLKIAPWCLLIASNVFMTFAWYGHLKNRSMTMLVAIFSSWLIALVVFTLFSVFYLGEAISWKTLVGFGFILAGVAIVMFFK
jgi:uncharacterized protein (DUF486 family)